MRGVEAGVKKQFYLGTSQEFYSNGQLRMGLYLPESVRPEELIARPFENSPFDRRLLYQAVLELAGYDFGRLQLRILADDLRLVS